MFFIPCLLQGACHINIQLHRGSHSADHAAPIHAKRLESVDLLTRRTRCHRVVAQHQTEANLGLDRTHDLAAITTRFCPLTSVLHLVLETA